MKGNVTGHYVAVKPDVIEKKSDGGIILSDKYVDREQLQATTGIIVSIGDDAWRAFKSKKPWAKVGDRVWFIRNASKYVEDEDDLDEDGNPRKLFVMTDENIIWRYDTDDIDDFED